MPVDRADLDRIYLEFWTKKNRHWDPMAVEAAEGVNWSLDGFNLS